MIKKDVHADKSDDDLFNFDIDIEDRMKMRRLWPASRLREAKQGFSAQERAEAEEFDLMMRMTMMSQRHSRTMSLQMITKSQRRTTNLNLELNLQQLISIW